MASADNQARRSAIAGWFLEVSALLLVFPVLDQLIRDSPFSWPIAVVGVAGALTAFFVGVVLTRGQS